MKKIICGKVYDTETSTVVKKDTYGYYGDPTGYEEVLFVNPEGFYFMYVNGGADSKYVKEDIVRVGKKRAKSMLS
ncbi:MAG: hypothetical protein J6B16_03965 [Clostridia bacterium]|nr:hypothetical protein [Clostridia bacterium]